MQNMGELSDEQLLAGVQASVGEERRWVARVIAYLAEIERRSLHLEAACSSLFEFCRRRLGMSEGEAFRRMTAARLAQRFPVILDLLDGGDVHLSALVLLRDHLTDENHEELLRAAAGRSKVEIGELIAARSPKPDVPSRIEDLAPQAPLDLGASAPMMTTPPEPRAHVEPLSPARYRVELTASKELRDKLERAQDLMRHRNPSGDLAVVLDAALDLLLAKLEKERLGKTTRAKKNESPEKKNRPGYISRPVRRAVFERDGEQCTFVDDEGHRCAERGFLELDHVVSKALGGTDDVDNLRVRCRAHNQHHAEQVFGRDHVERRIHLRQRKCGPADASTFDIADRALRSLGFKEAEIRRALAIVRAKLDATASIETIIREAIAVAT